MFRPGLTSALAAVVLTFACGVPSTESDPIVNDRRDHHSYSNPEEVRVRHVDLDLDVRFAEKKLEGTATLTLEGAARTLMLDTRDLTITGAEASSGGETFAAAPFELGETHGALGTPLRIELPSAASHVRVHYATSPAASGLQWLEPAQTAGGRHPYLFTQSQAIHARSWIPLQDSPGVRVTYSAVVRTPRELLAVMSAEMEENPQRTGEYRFNMPQAIPPYLIALAVGDLAFEATGGRSGAYSEPPLVSAAAREFEDVEKMMEAAERLYGPYRWGRYDILVLPPSFPYGGMENPRLTFATPTLIAGDKSLVGVIAHELAHSWSGNLVTNATWRDFWLNEGFTVYLESRIQEEVYGKERADMEGALEVSELEEQMSKLEPRDQVLHVDLAGRDPDDGFTLVPYVKGALLLRTLEGLAGRERWDEFLRGYFDRFAFQSITTADFAAYLREQLPGAAGEVGLSEWLTQPGIPANAARPQSDAFTRVEETLANWARGGIAANELPAGWSTHEWLHFLGSLPADLPLEKMRELDAQFDFTRSRNAEIAHRWLLESVKRGYEPAYPRLEQFLVEVGRRKFLKPLYEELAKTEEGKRRAAGIYEKARPGYHPIAQTTVDEILAGEQ